MYMKPFDHHTYIDAADACMVHGRGVVRDGSSVKRIIILTPYSRHSIQTINYIHSMMDRYGPDR